MIETRWKPKWMSIPELSLLRKQLKHSKCKCKKDGKNKCTSCKYPQETLNEIVRVSKNSGKEAKNFHILVIIHKNILFLIC